ncbi:class I SAM-dependent methyltransferase [Nocardioides pantholopis]|uniref:class I SAM-dependent methyltransferase n=1 Tax=Nocardioides pantholopis TaxID=2483798 RepID=UPI000FDC9F26|nr:class I SAM-dependent methyltransferase [Nocardioides pantholopis]
MSSDERPTTAMRTTADDYALSYYNEAHLGGAGEYDWSNDHWRGFFTMVAERIVGLTEPTSVLDVGCAKGLLVQALAGLRVDARGFDISDFAVESAHPDVRDRLWVASATEPIDGRYDLITCIEVLEHMDAADAQRAIDAMCAASDRILFSSTPSDFAESTHINVHPTAQWAAWFAERGFYRRTDADTSFLTTWAILFERAELSKRTVVERYEAQLAPLNAEILDKRRALLDAHRRIDRLTTEAARSRPDDDALLARHAALVARDNVIGLEAQIGVLQAQLAQARSRLTKTRAKLAGARTQLKRARAMAKRRQHEVDALRESRSWRVGQAVVSPLGKLKR